jgi:hypothetical protein
MKTLAPNQQRIADQIGGSAKEVLAAMENRAQGMQALGSTRLARVRRPHPRGP